MALLGCFALDLSRFQNNQVRGKVMLVVASCLYISQNCYVINMSQMKQVLEMRRKVYVLKSNPVVRLN